MDQPVVMLERLPDDIIAKYLKRDMKIYEYNHGYKQLPREHFPSKKHARNKPYWIKRGTLHGKFYNNAVLHKHSSSKVGVNGFYNSFHEQNTNSELYSKKDNFHHGQRKGNNIMLVPNHFHKSEYQTTGSQVSSEVENARTFSNNQDGTNKIVSSEQLLRQGKKRHISGESRKDVTSLIEDGEDGSENLIPYEDFDSHDWQIVSEASCSDVSLDASPSHDNLDSEYSVPTEAEINEASSKHKITCIDDNVSTIGGKLQDTLCSQNANLSQISDDDDDDDDDRLTEPYRSECEEESSKVQDVKSTKSLKSLRIKLTGSHKNGFTNVTNESDKHSRNKLKAVTMSESKDESNISKLTNARNIKISSNLEKSTESIKNGQGVTNKETKFSRYDYVGLIMQTMDKSGPYSVNAKSDDTAQKSHGTGESQNFKSSSINKIISYKEPSNAPNGKELPEMPYLKQRKARMSRPAMLSKTKSFLCRDLKGGTGVNNPHLTYMSRPINTSEPKPNLVVKDHIKISGDRKVDAVGNIVSSGKLNSTVLTDKQGVRSLVTKMHTGRLCWRCGKPFGSNSNITDRLCKQCNAVDYTTVTQRITSIQTNQKSKDNESSNKLFKISYNHSKNKNSSEIVTSPDRSKLTVNSCYSNATTLLHHNNEKTHISNDHVENENLSPLKLKVSLGTKLVEKGNKDKNVTAGDIEPKKLKKKRMRSASDTVEGIYESNKRVAIDSEQTSGGNLIYRITKRKGKHKDLSKKRKKIKLGAEDEGSDISGYYSEDNITSKCKSKELPGEPDEMLLAKSADQVEVTTDHNASSSAKAVLNRKGNCEVRSVNKGLFLLSFPETDEENYHLESVLGEYPRKQSSQKLDSRKETSNVHLNTSGNTNTVPQRSVSSEQTDLPPSSSASPTEKPPSPTKESCPTLLDLHSLVNTSDSAITAISQEMPIFQNISSEQNKNDSNKFQETNNVCDGTSSESKLSTLKIESVYSLQDLSLENNPDEKRTNSEKIPFLLKYNTFNELDAYTTASILDMDGTKERSLSVLTSLLNREYKGLQYVYQLSKKSDIIKADLHTEKERHIDNIRTLQLACALFKKCQKCNKELSHEMLNMKSDEISQLLSECDNVVTAVLTMTGKNDDTDKASLSHQTLENNDKEEHQNKGSDGDCAKERMDIEVKDDDKQEDDNTTDTQKTVKFLLQPKLDSPAAERKSDDDVICLGVSQLPKSSVHSLRSPDHQSASHNDSSNCIQQSVEATSNSQNSMSPCNFSPGVVPPNVSVIKSHGLANSPAVSNFISSSNSIPLQVIPGVVNHSLQAAVNAISNAATYQKAAANCFVKHQNYSLPANSLSVQKDSTDSLKQLYVVSQLNKLPNGTTWIPSSIQPQWTSHPNQALATSTSANEALTNMRNQGWRNKSPLQSNTPPSVPTQQKPVQQMPNPMLPLISQFGTAVSSQRAVHAGMPVQATRGLPPVPPMYSHSAIRAWHQPSNPLGAAALRQTQQTPVVCIACRKPIGMTCPTGMFCSEVCKKSYCAHFPNYR